MVILNRFFYILFVIALCSCEKNAEVSNIFVEGSVTLLDEFGDSTVIAQSGVKVRGFSQKTFTDYYGNFSLGNVAKERKLYISKAYFEDIDIDLSLNEGDYVFIKETMFHKPVTWVHDLEVSYEEVDDSGFFILTFSGLLTPFDEHLDRRSFEVFIDNSPNVGPDHHLMSFVFDVDQENQQFAIPLPTPISFYNQGIDNYLYAVAYGRSSFNHDGYPIVMHNNRSNLFEFIPH